MATASPTRFLKSIPGSHRVALSRCSQKRRPRSTPLLSASIGVSIIGFRGLLAIAAAYLAFVHLRESPPLERAVTFQISPPESFATSDVDSIALSPNGDRLLFVGVRPDGGRHYGCGLLIHWRRPHSPALSWSIRRFGRPTAALWRSSQQAN